MTCRRCGYSGADAERCPQCGTAVSQSPAPRGPIDPMAELGGLYAGTPARPASAPRAGGASARTPVPLASAPAGKRPTSMTVIGWLFIVGAAFTALSALMGLFTARMMTEMAHPEAMALPPDAPPTLHLFMSLLPYFWLLSLAQLAVAAFVLYAAIQFLRRRAWARAALEGIAWTAIVGTVGVMVAWGYTWTSLTAGVPPPPGAPAAVSFTALGIGMAVVIGAIYLVPLGVIVGVLRGRTIRGAVVR